MHILILHCTFILSLFFNSFNRCLGSSQVHLPKRRNQGLFIPIGAKLSRGRWPTWVYALHIMRRKVSMCSSRNCLHYLASQQSILLQHLLQSANSNQLQQLMTYLSDTWLHNAVWSIRQWSVHQQSVRTNNDVEGKLFYYLNKISCNISVKFHLYHTYRDTV